MPKWKHLFRIIFYPCPFIAVVTLHNIRLFRAPAFSANITRIRKSQQQKQRPHIYRTSKLALQLHLKTFASLIERVRHNLRSSTDHPLILAHVRSHRRRRHHRSLCKAHNQHDEQAADAARDNMERHERDQQ